MTEAPLVGGIVIIVIAFISHLNKRDREVRKILEMFSDRIVSLESAIKELRTFLRNGENDKRDDWYNRP